MQALNFLERPDLLVPMAGTACLAGICISYIAVVDLSQALQCFSCNSVDLLSVNFLSSALKFSVNFSVKIWAKLL